ncbi:hypothetical protein K2Q02_02825, partial [Patescibacteria group bacterium]|nr:hypothetical protein [Patescibacteria group bacterium]
MKATAINIVRSKTSKVTLALFAFAIAIMFGANHGNLSLNEVRALSAFNTNPQDYATLRSANYTDFPDSTNNWALDTQAKAGDVVSLTVYYHNSANETAYNVRTAIAVPTNVGTDIVATGSIDSDNFSSSLGQSTVHLSSSQSLEYIQGSAKWYPNQSVTPTPFPFGQTGDEVVTAQGVNIGDVDSGWPTQGSVVARFQVSNTVVPPVDTNPGISNVDITANSSQGPLALSGNDPFSVDWISQNVTDCSVTTADNLFSTGVEVNGSLGVVNPTHPFYPAENS